MKNTIDNADYIINCVNLIVTYQYDINSRHSHSIVYDTFFILFFNEL